jgi:hypothetical protein
VKQIPLRDAENTVRIDNGRVYVGPGGGGFVNPPNDTIWDFDNRERLHKLLDDWLDEAEKRLSARGQ